MPRLAVLLKGYPRLSETFIAQEILALEQAGLDLEIVSLRRPTDPAVHPVHREITAPVRYLPEYLYEAPGRVLRGWLAARRLPGYRRALRRFLHDLARDRTASRLRRFGQACVAAAELPQETERLYVHFLHTPGSVAHYAALIRGLPWSASAHARDIWTTPAWEKRGKLADLDWLVTCTAVGRDHLAALAERPDSVSLLYHGLDLARFPAPPAARPPRDGSDPAAPVHLLSVGRAVEKKGYDDLLEALARLPESLVWRLTHIGGGALAGTLKRRAAALGLAERIEWLGPRTQEEVLAAYRAADLFVLASREAGDGDRDGLPNVLMEAQSQGLACLATRFSAIPELILDGQTGRLVPPGDPAALAEALAALIPDPAERGRLGGAGAERVRRHFDFQANVQWLVERLGGQRPSPGQPAAAL